MTTAVPSPEIESDRIGSLNRAARRAVVAANPRSGSSSGLIRSGEIVEGMQARGWDAVLISDRDLLHRRILEWQASGELGCVVSAGGDGTAGMIAAWLEPGTPLAVFPLGTENLLAKHWRMPTQVDEFLTMIEAGVCVDCDAGSANDQIFLLHATVGFDAEVVRLLHENRTGHIHHWSYLAPIFKSIRRYPYPTIAVRTSTDRRPLHVRWAFVFNFPCYAMGLPIVSDAEGTDGELDLLTFRGGNLMNGLKYFFGVVFRRHRSWRDTHLERTTWLRLEAEAPVPFQLDGDPGGYLPLEIKLLPRRFRLVVPPAAVEREALSGAR